tara:strand:- start:251 stop:625 length:375 start_codon:yes stop_codon:yes gene_type:complete
MWDRNTRNMMDMWMELLNEIERAPMTIYSSQPRRHGKEVQVNEENGTITITAELAGLDKDQVDIEVSNRSVTIKAESEKKNFSWDQTFDYEIDPDSVKATMVNGILDMSIEKKEKTSAKKVDIE